MNLNPLKKDDNTDALVKALEDANNMGAAPATDSSSDSTTPVVGQDVLGTPSTDNVAPSMDTSSPVVNDVDNTVSAIAQDMEKEDGLSSDNADTASTDTPTSDTTTSDLNLDSSDVSSVLSTDADAHLDLGSGDGELDDVKKSALEQLRPLIEKLDLEPADKFDKYLMMLRASDDPALIKPAFDAAQGITGEKEKAQALLDIINEINYITANKQQESN